MTRLVIDSGEALDNLYNMIQQAHLLGKVPVIEFESEPKKQRTGKQNRSLHKYLTLLAKALNDAGWDQRKTLKEEVEIPWNEWSAKEFLWRGIQKAMYGTDSTTELDTVQCQEVYKVLDRHLASKTGVSVAWPCEDNMRMDSHGN